MMGNRPIASLSFDMDNLWSYLKVHGDKGWDEFPSYLDVVVPRVLDFLAVRKQRLTFFVVGQDAALPRNRAAFEAIGRSVHEVGNHSFHHEPWLHRYSAADAEAEIARAEEAIEAATGRRPTGFRGPGFSVSGTVLRVLQKRGYQYDASTLPTFIGPLARAYYFMTARLEAKEREERSVLFGTVADGLRPVAPYRWHLGAGSLLEIPVTTMPIVRVPFHLSYVLYLGTYSTFAARQYFRTGLLACRCTGVEPSILLHPLDFLGGEDAPRLSFFPAMRLRAEDKLDLVHGCLDDLAALYDTRPMGEHAALLEGRDDLPLRTPDLAIPG
jgi:hypothetical protein